MIKSTETKLGQMVKFKTLQQEYHVLQVHLLETCFGFLASFPRPGAT